MSAISNKEKEHQKKTDKTFWYPIKWPLPLPTCCHRCTSLAVVPAHVRMRAKAFCWVVPSPRSIPQHRQLCHLPLGYWQRWGGVRAREKWKAKLIQCSWSLAPVLFHWGEMGILSTHCSLKQGNSGLNAHSWVQGRGYTSSLGILWASFENQKHVS